MAGANIRGMDALLIVDFQNDFTPGGALPVERGDEIAGPINALAERFELVVATRDWHPPDHGSFVGAEVDPDRWEGVDPPGIWPVHCVQGTPGADFHPALDHAHVDVVVDKGQPRDTEGYSAFQETTLEALLRERGIDQVTIVGLATDYCVKQTALEALKEGFAVTVDTIAVRGVDVEPGDSDRALAELRAAGAVMA